MDYTALIYSAAAIIVLHEVPFTNLGYAAACAVLMVLVPLAYLSYSRRRLGDYLIRFGDVRRGAKISALLIIAAFPVMYYGSTLPQFIEYYPTWKPAAASVWNFLAYEAYMFVLIASTEVFYRGFLLGVLLDGTRHGNVIHSAAYMLAHLGKPPLEVVYSLPVGWLFGKADQECKSIMPSLAMHYLSSVIFDLMVLHQAGVRLL